MIRELAQDIKWMGESLLDFLFGPVWDFFFLGAIVLLYLLSRAALLFGAIFIIVWMVKLALRF